MTEAFLGIDISKKTFDVALLIKDKVKTKKFNNTKAGYDQLFIWLNNKQIVVTQACMEATGVYGLALAEFLYNHQVLVSVVNPARIKGFSQSELARAKNDVLDAKLIARFCKLIRPEPWEPTPESVKILQHWVRRLDDLIAMQRQEQNRVEVAGDCLIAHIRGHITHIENQIQEIKKIINKHIDDNPNLKKKVSYYTQSLVWVTQQLLKS